VPRALGDLRGRPGLHDLPGVEHHDAVAQLGDQREVVGDEEHGHAALVAQLPQQLDDFRLDGDVERGRGLVGHEQLRVARHGDGDHDPLQHAARQLGRNLVEDALGLAQSHRAEQLCCPPAGGGAGQPPLDPEDLGQLVANGDRRIQVGRGVLEHGAHVAAMHPLPVPLRQGRHVVTGERHRALLDGAAGGEHAEGGPAGQRLAAARLPDQPDDLAGLDPQRDAAHGGGRAVVHGDVQVVDAQHLACAWPWSLADAGARAGRDDVRQRTAIVDHHRRSPDSSWCG